MPITAEQVERAVNLVTQYSQEQKAGVSIYRDQERVPMVFVTACPHCAELFDQFAQLSDEGKATALQRAGTPGQHQTEKGE